MIALCLLSAGCGAGHISSGMAQLGRVTSSTVPQAGHASGSDFAQGMLAYAECMRKNGVPDYPDPNSKGQIAIDTAGHPDLGPGSPQMLAAAKACRSVLPPGPTPAQQSEDLAQMLRYSRCMRSHGALGFPDPSGAGGGANFVFHNFRSTSQVVGAEKACQYLMPGLQLP
jgi:hypothetical protein